MYMARKKEIIQVNELSDKTKYSMKVRIISSIIAIGIVIPAVLFGDWLFVALILFVTVIGAREIINCAKPKHSRWLTFITAILVVLLAFWPILRKVVNPETYVEGINQGWTLYGSFETIYLSILVLAISFISLFWMVICDSQFSVRDACFVFTIGVVLALGFQSLIFLRFAPIYEHHVLLKNDDTSYLSLFKNLLKTHSIIILQNLIKVKCFFDKNCVILVLYLDFYGSVCYNYSYKIKVLQ